MLTLLRAHRTQTAVSLLLLCGATALLLAQPVLAGRLVDRAVLGSAALAPTLVLTALLICQLSLEAVARFRLDRIGESVVLGLRADFTDHVVRLPVGLLDHSRTGDLLARGASDAGLLRDMPRAVGDIAFGALTLIAAGAFMLAIDAVAVGVAVVVMVAAFAAGNPFLSRIQRASLKRQAALGDYTAALDRALGAARTVKVFGAEEREAVLINADARRAHEHGVRVASATAANTLLIRLGVTGAFVAILIIDGRRVAGGEVSAGQLVSLLAFAVYAIFPITAAFAAFATVRVAAGGYQHLTATLRDLPEGDPPSVTVAGDAPADRSDTDGALVEFDRVSFSYGGQRVLDDVSFTLDRGRITALVGPSGAGKTTILSLLCRFHDPDSGTVRWAGRDIRDLPLADLRARLGLLEQDAPVLHGTVRDNLLIADRNATDDDLWRALRQAKIHDEIAALAGGLDAPVLERGRALSGGQRQRLALARALLSRSELILMDEPTAHLDRANEYDVMTNLRDDRGARAALVVAHRLSTVTTADRIVLLQSGRVQACGTHAELLDLPAYRRLVEHELDER
jgi:ABC-type multidrug transport system fused ATPase/permease subunit